MFSLRVGRSSMLRRLVAGFTAHLSAGFEFTVKQTVVFFAFGPSPLA
jgi:hypothetical protein